MKHSEKTKNSTLYVCTAAAVAAMYVVLTWISAAVGLASGVIQFRISEALCVFALFTPAAVPGLTIGCLAADLLSGCAAYDILFGTLATLAGALGVRALRFLPDRLRFLAPLPYFAANTLVLPFVLRFVYGAEGTLPFFFASVGAGEAVCAWLGGALFDAGLRRCGVERILSGTKKPRL